MRLGLGLALGVMAASVASAQVTRLEAPGNLAATVDPGCIGIDGADAALAPPDLGRGVLACAAQEEWDLALELYVLMQLRAEFDKERVADQTAWQAEDVLSMQVTEALPPGGRDKLIAAFDRYGGIGSPRHAELCVLIRDWEPPSHDPSWMIQHGMGAFLGQSGNGLLSGFDPVATWKTVQRDYMKCG
jgi:hypothetical protein